MDEHLRLRLATRINHLLMRELGEGVDVGMLLKRAPYAAEVLYVCAASGNEELKSLGAEFALATQAHHARVVEAMERAAAPSKAAASSGWPSSPSDFSPSQPVDDPTQPRRRATAAVRSSFAPWNG